MDLLTFIYSTINALAWPAAAITAAAMFKQPLKDLIGAVINIKWKGGEIAFDRGIKDVAQESEKVLPPPSSPPQIEVRVHDAVATAERVSNLGELHPPVLILQSWFLLETELRKLAERRALPKSNELPTHVIANELRVRDVLDKQTYSIFASLRQLRNQVVHVRPDSVTLDQAQDYNLAVQRLIARLREL